MREVPRAKDIYKLADYWEIKCVANVDGVFGVGDLETAIEEADDFSFGSVFDPQELGLLPEQKEPEPDDDIEIQEAGFADLVGEAMDGGAIPGLQAVADDWKAATADDVLAHLRARADMFGNWYPFTVLESHLRFDGSEFLGVRAYLFLLYSANLRYLRKASVHHFTSGFESLSADALRAYLPAHAEVYVFGKGDQTATRYKGTAFDKVKLLARDLRYELRARPEQFQASDTGDIGIDIVGWIPLADAEFGRINILGQCACGQWIAKQFQAHDDSLFGYFDMRTRALHVVFIPQCFRQADANWYNPLRIHRSVLLDRPRILELLKRAPELRIPSDEILQSVIDYRDLDDIEDPVDGEPEGTVRPTDLEEEDDVGTGAEVAA